MSTISDDIKIDLDAIEDPKTKPDKAGKEKAPTAKEADKVTPEDGLAKLQKQLDDERAGRETERRGREDAERRANEANDREFQARSKSQGDQLALISTALENVKNAGMVLRTEYATALAAQDFDKAAEIQEAMSDNSAKKIQLEAGKTHLEKQPKATPVKNPPPTDLVEQFVSEMSPRSAAWVRAHPEYVRDAKLNRKMIRAHEDALELEIAADTPEYFASIEKTLGLTKEPITTIEDEKLDDPTKDAAAAPTRKTAPPAAPVTRSGNGAGNRQNVVTLTPEEVEMAEATGQTVEEYARNKQALKKEGRLN